MRFSSIITVNQTFTCKLITCVLTSYFLSGDILEYSWQVCGECFLISFKQVQRNYCYMLGLFLFLPQLAHFDLFVFANGWARYLLVMWWFVHMTFVVDRALNIENQLSWNEPPKVKQPKLWKFRRKSNDEWAPLRHVTSYLWVMEEPVQAHSPGRLSLVFEARRKRGWPFSHRLRQKRAQKC